MSVLSSYVTNLPPSGDIYEIWYLNIFFFFRKSVKKIIWLTWDKNGGYLTWRGGRLWQYLAELLLEWELFQTKVVEKNQNANCTFGNIFLQSWHLWNNVGKYGRGGQTTDGNTIECLRFACCITKAIETFRKYNSKCCYTATMVTRTRLNVAFKLALPLLVWIRKTN